MFNTAKDFKDYIKQTLKSKGACSAPSQASIWQIYRSNKFRPVAKSYHPTGDAAWPLEGTGNVIWKNANGACEQNNNSHKYCAFYLGYDDKILGDMPLFFIHFEFDSNNIYNVGIELLACDMLLRVPKNPLIQHIFNLF
jgi:hypothetical protein